MKTPKSPIRYALLACALSGVAFAVSGCSTVKSIMAIPPAVQTTTKVLNNRLAVASAPVYIYKMKKDYSQNVPVTLNAARTKVVSYPAPTDLKTNGVLAVPTPLDNGFWLDNRGINENVAFLSYTYEEYSQLSEAPTAEELMEHIIDKDPLTEIHYCGRRSEFKDLVAELNTLIAERYGRQPEE